MSDWLIDVLAPWQSGILGALLTFIAGHWVVYAWQVLWLHPEERERIRRRDEGYEAAMRGEVKP